MTDKDATTLRTIVAKYGFTRVFQELYRITIRYSDHNPARWARLKRCLEGVVHCSTMTIGLKGI